MNSTPKAEGFLATRKQVLALRQQLDLFASAVEQEPDPVLRARYKQTLASLEIDLKRLEKAVKSIWSSIFPWLHHDRINLSHLSQLEEKLQQDQTMYNELSMARKRSRILEAEMQRLPRHIHSPSVLSEIGMPLVAWESRPDNPKAKPPDPYGSYDTRPPFKPFWEGPQSGSTSSLGASVDHGYQDLGNNSSSQIHSPHQSSVSGFQGLSPPPYHRTRRHDQAEQPSAAEAEVEANPRSSFNEHFKYPDPSLVTGMGNANPSSEVHGNVNRGSREGEPSYSQTYVSRSQAPFNPQNHGYGPITPVHRQGRTSHEAPQSSQQDEYNDGNTRTTSNEDEDDDMYL